MTDYMRMLRKLVGSSALMQCAASMIVYNEKNEVLLQKRSDNNLWCYHGGAIELGENSEETAKRELYEETGLTALNCELFGVYSGENQHYFYPNNDEVYIIDIVYICNSFEGKKAIDHNEVKELKWFSVNEIPENLMPPIVEPLHDFISHFKINSYK